MTECKQTGADAEVFTKTSQRETLQRLANSGLDLFYFHVDLKFLLSDALTVSSSFITVTSRGAQLITFNQNLIIIAAITWLYIILCKQKMILSPWVGSYADTRVIALCQM